MLCDCGHDLEAHGIEIGFDLRWVRSECNKCSCCRFYQNGEPVMVVGKKEKVWLVSRTRAEVFDKTIGIYSSKEKGIKAAKDDALSYLAFSWLDVSYGEESGDGAISFRRDGYDWHVEDYEVE